MSSFLLSDDEALAKKAETKEGNGRRVSTTEGRAEGGGGVEGRGEGKQGQGHALCLWIGIRDECESFCSTT